jgi:phosphatidyl-myo-inositol dimannoside synthase
MTASIAHGIVLLTCEYPPFPGGIGTYSGSLVQAVREGGLSATVIAPCYPNLPADSDPDVHRILRHHRIGPAAAFRLLRILRNMPAERVILAADIRSVITLYALRHFHRRAYRAMVHGSEASKFTSRSIVFDLARRAYLSADSVVFNSRATQRVFENGFGVPRRGVVAHLGIDPRWFVPVTGAFTHEALAALPVTATVVCSVGRIEPRKGQIETLRALARARESYGVLDPVYVVAGVREDRDYAASVLEEGKRLNVPVIETGRLSESDLKRLYRRAICHSLCAQALPGKLEGFGLVLLEAAAQECPSVAPSTGGIPEVLGETGTLVPVGDTDAVAQAFAAYAADTRVRELHGAAALLRARNFTWGACAAATFPELFSVDSKRTSVSS